MSEVPPEITDESTRILYADLLAAKAPRKMIERCEKNLYHDYKSAAACGIAKLVEDARYYMLTGIVASAVDGKYDGTKTESEEWAKSPEGQESFRDLMRGI